MQRTTDDLRTFSEHLLYELQMLFRLADRLRAHTDGKEQLSWEIEMACIESFAIHMRADQIVGGTAINFLAVGVTGYFYIQIYGLNGTVFTSSQR